MPSLMVLVVEVLLVVDVKVCLPLVERPRPQSLLSRMPPKSLTFSAILEVQHLKKPTLMSVLKGTQSSNSNAARSCSDVTNNNRT